MEVYLELEDVGRLVVADEVVREVKVLKARAEAQALDRDESVGAEVERLERGQALVDVADEGNAVVLQV